MTSRSHYHSPQERTAILTIHAASRRIAVRRFAGAEAEAAACYWTAIHVNETLSPRSPLIRIALALDLAPTGLIDRMNGYRPLAMRDKAACNAAYGEFRDLCAQMAGAAPERPGA